MNIHEKMDIVLDGWVITEVGIIDKSKYLVVAQWDNDDEDTPYHDKVDDKKYNHPTRMMSIDIRNNKIKFITSLDGVTGVKCDGGRTSNNIEAFFGSFNGATYHLDYKKNTFELEEILMHPDRVKAHTSRGINEIRLIGEHFYTIDSFNEVHRRDALKVWTFLSKEPKEYYNKISEDDAECLASFSEKEIYFAGEKGSLWSYDTKVWHKVTEIPSQGANFEYIECCEDGKVYAIDSHAEGVAVGRGTTFRYVPMKKDDPIKGHILYDVCTFQGKVYLTDGDIYEFREDHWVKAEIPDVYGSVEHLAAKDGVMFIGTPYSLKIYNGKETFTLYGERKETEKLLGQQALNLGLELIDKKDEIIETLSDMKKL